MLEQIRNQIDWPQPFPPEEYRERREKVAAALAAAGFDAMLVTAPRDYHYLTGQDHIWQYLGHVTGLFFDVAAAHFVFFDQESHRVINATTPEIGDIIYVRRGSAAEQADYVAGELVARGLARGRIAIQTWEYGPHPDLVRAMGARLAASGAEVVEAVALIEDVRLYKSAREIAVMREGGVIAVAAMRAAQAALGPDMGETEIDAVLCHELLCRGCGHPAIRTMVGSGPRSGAHHGPASARRVRAGDLVHLDFCASLHRYHTNLSRSLAVGEVDPRWHDLMARSAGCAAAIVEGAGPGDPYSQVQRAADAFIAAAGIDRARHEWYIGGYTLGIAFPPDWVHRHRPVPREAVPDPVMRPGMVFNFEVQYDVFDGWPGGTGAGWIDSFLVTETGIEILTDMPRGLLPAGA